jgi:hypothetical protein
MDCIERALFCKFIIPDFLKVLSILYVTYSAQGLEYSKLYYKYHQVKT